LRDLSGFCGIRPRKKFKELLGCSYMLRLKEFLLLLIKGGSGGGHYNKLLLHTTACTSFIIV
jgi:hypothetical protein